MCNELITFDKPIFFTFLIIYNEEKWLIKKFVSPLISD